MQTIYFSQQSYSTNWKPNISKNYLYYNYILILAWVESGLTKMLHLTLLRQSHMPPFAYHSNYQYLVRPYLFQRCQSILYVHTANLFWFTQANIIANLIIHIVWMQSFILCVCVSVKPVSCYEKLKGKVVVGNENELHTARCYWLGVISDDRKGLFVSIL